MTKTTVWSRMYKGKWRHNHIENSWSSNDTPIILHDSQRKMWNDAIWKKRFAYLINYKVCYV